MRLRQTTILTFITTCIVPASLALCDHLPTAEPESLGISSVGIGRVSEYVDSLVTRGEVPGAVAIVAYKGKVILHKAAGLAERTPARPMRRDTIFRIASMTKPLTSVAIMMLYDEGKIALGDPVSKYIPEFANPRVVSESEPRAARREITIRDLLTHTSGLGYENAEKVGELYIKAGIAGGPSLSSVRLDENIGRLARIPLLFDPGERFSYGFSTDVLGLVVERASGMSFDKFIERQICKPLGMDDTFFQIPLSKQGRLAAAFVGDDTAATGVRELGDSEQILNDSSNVRMSPDYPCAVSHRYRSGGSGMSSTAEDYLRFCQMILNRGRFNGVALLRPTTIDMMTANQVGDIECGVVGLKFKFGFGFAVFPRTDDLRSEIFWGGIWGTVFRISKEGGWIGILMTQRAFDETSVPRESEFTRLVREAIQKSDGS